jgi:hypothetical protein
VKVPQTKNELEFEDEFHRDSIKFNQMDKNISNEMLEFGQK